MKKFKSKRKFKFKFKLIFYILIIIITTFFTFYLIKDIRFASSKKELIYYLIKDKDHLDNYDSFFKKSIYKISNILTSFDVNKPETILYEKLVFKTDDDKAVVKEVKLDNKVDSNINKDENTKPLLYLYNTHQVETYDPGNLSDFGLTPDVVMAANLLKDMLIEKDVNVLLEERLMSDYLKDNNLDYNYSYYASRYYFEDILKNNKIDMAIDLHRDALPKYLSTATINNKNYAKIMFVMGCKSSYCTSNTNVANILISKLENKYPGITRPIISRDYSYYNQDLITPSLLIELGGNYNNTEEVLNSVIALSDVISEYFKETYGK